MECSTGSWYSRAYAIFQQLIVRSEGNTAPERGKLYPVYPIILRSDHLPSKSLEQK
jgi:hypothetical protein